MIADFGLSRVMEAEKLQLLTEICGTPGVSLFPLSVSSLSWELVWGWKVCVWNARRWMGLALALGLAGLDECGAVKGGVWHSGRMWRVAWRPCTWMWRAARLTFYLFS